MDYNITYRKKDKSIQAIISYKNNNGTWKQKSKQGFKTQKDAKPWIEKIVKELKENLEYEINNDLKDLTFEELYKMFIKHAELYRASNTMVGYDTVYNNFIDIKDIEVTDITPIKIQEMVDNLVKSGLKSSTIEGYIGKLRKIFSYAVDYKAIKDNPVSVTIPKDKKVDKVKALTTSELDDLLSKIKNPAHKMISKVAATCGLRLGEILGITWDNINIKESTLKIDKQWKVTIKKPITYGLGKLKSPNSYRTIPIPPYTLKEILKYKEEYPISISNRIFPYARTDSCGKVLNELYKKLGYDISIHDLRHTYASRLVANGLDFKTIAHLLGDTVEVVINTYSHFTNDMLDNAKKIINSVF